MHVGESRNFVGPSQIMLSSCIMPYLLLSEYTVTACSDINFLNSMTRIHKDILLSVHAIEAIHLFIAGIQKGGAAEENGEIKWGDMILKVNNTCVIGMSQTQVQELLANASPNVRFVLLRQYGNSVTGGGGGGGANNGRGGAKQQVQ